MSEKEKVVDEKEKKILSYCRICDEVTVWIDKWGERVCKTCEIRKDKEDIFEEEEGDMF